MTIPKKGSRSLTLNGVEYRYLIKADKISQYDCDGGKTLYNHVTIQIGTGHGQVFQYKEPMGVAIKPSDIETAIIEALIRGWEPTKSGRAFTLLEGRYGRPETREEENKYDDQDT